MRAPGMRAAAARSHPAAAAEAAAPTPVAAIAVCADFTGDSVEALWVAARLARAEAADLHVVLPLGLIGLSLREAFRPLHDPRFRRAGELLEDLLDREVRAVIEPVTARVDPRDAPRALSDLVREVGARLAVLPEHLLFPRRGDDARPDRHGETSDIVMRATLVVVRGDAAGGRAKAQGRASGI